jgi:hypothetical protein
MSIRIDGVTITNHEAYWALLIAARNPQAFGISPAALSVGQVREPHGNGEINVIDVNFSAAQVLQILNPSHSEDRRIDRDDMTVRAGQCGARLQERHFAGLAQEFSRRFPAALSSARITVHSDISTIRLPRGTEGARSYFEHFATEGAIEASDPDIFFNAYHPGPPPCLRP